jgi:hypothetical protein
MSIEEESTSWALSVVDALESPENNNVRLAAAAGAAVITIIMWVTHLIYPDIFLFFLEQKGWAKLLCGVVLAPPFVLAYAAGCFICPQAIEPATDNESGPMSGYFYRERASKRWKVLIGAGLVAALNFLLMFVTTGV